MEKEKTLPGTRVPAGSIDEKSAAAMFDGLFAGGGLVLSQVASLTGIEPYTVQNWVQRGYLSPPAGKKYDRGQVCRLITINMLKDALPIGQVVFLLSSVNGDLADKGDDTVEDDRLYLYFLAALSKAEGKDGEELRKAAEDAVKGYREPKKGAKKRLAEVLRVFVLAYRASLARRLAEEAVAELKRG